MFGTDPKVQEIAKRYGDPKAVANALIAAQQRIRSGEYKRAQPKDQTPEAMAAWRQENGIPEAAADYGIHLPEGVDASQLDDSAKARFEHFNNEFHKLNLPKDVVASVYKAYNDQVLKDAEAQAQADAQLADATADALLADWGKDYRGNLKTNLAWLDREIGKDMTSALMDARFADGRRLMDVPEIAKAINKWARNDGGDIIDSGDGGTANSVEAQIEAIQKVMNTDIGKYRADGLDKKLSELLAIQEKRGKLPQYGPQ